MIPPSSTMGDSAEKDDELGNTEQPHSPASTSSQESKLQKLKKSLSFKTKSVRSKSADNFFQRTNIEMKFQVDPVDLEPEGSPINASQIQSSETQPSTPTKVPQPPDSKAHVFQEHVFKKPTFCDVCNHMIVACGNKVDPVYETLRFGTSLAQKNKKSSSGSGSDSPNRSSTTDLLDVPEEGDNSYLLDIGRQRSDSVFSYLENGTESVNEEQQQRGINSTIPIFKDAEDTFVALYKFVPQENQDLAMRPGDKITILDDSNEDWWKGKIEDRIGFFPANFVQKVQNNEILFRCTRTFIGCKEQGEITLKENQICASSEKENNGFLKVISGKKNGFVPIDILENI
ncbi:SH3 and cysteine-rich domain-containing protein isoform X3 [Dendrobates tinctorius]|uniref:SH3 and cysteine-rich domain-containing protein isoform X3 n=1 Tax=Dendrobates tinctorius TaxID=92724 RepID=UPI003CCA4245